MRNRLLQQAWNLWTERTKVKHSYNHDIRVILSRKLPDDQQRSEFEIEVIFKWLLYIILLL